MRPSVFLRLALLAIMYFSATKAFSQGWVASGTSTLYSVNNSLTTNPVLIGIGTSAPSTQFHTTGGVRLAGITNNNTYTRVMVQDASGNVFYRDASTLGSSNAWLTTGNAGTNASVNFLGTTDNQRLAFRTNNTERFTILTSGYTGLNTNNPTKLFTAVGTNAADNAEVLIQQSAGTNLGAYLTLDNRNNGGNYWSIGSTGTLNTPTVAGTLEFYQLTVGTRMLIDGQGRLGLGLGNGILPTANFHTNGTVRLENLPAGTGNIVVIDANGNLFRSSSTARIGSGAAPAQEIESLKKELADLKAEVEILKRLLPEASIMPKFSFTINHPNPFNASTRIDYKIPETYNYSSGSIKVIDVNGNLVRQFPLSGNRTGQFQFVPQGNLNQTFIYSLELDGKVVESKKMIRSGN